MCLENEDFQMKREVCVGMRSKEKAPRSAEIQSAMEFEGRLAQPC